MRPSDCTRVAFFVSALVAKRYTLGTLFRCKIRLPTRSTAAAKRSSLAQPYMCSYSRVRLNAKRPIGSPVCRPQLPTGKERGAATDGLPPLYLSLWIPALPPVCPFKHYLASRYRHPLLLVRTRETPISLPCEVTALGIIAFYNQKTKIFG